MSEISSDQSDSLDSQSSTRQRSILYEEGATLNLTAADFQDRSLIVKIIKLYRPYSLSCTMKVEILKGIPNSGEIPQRAVLKLFDRRFATKLRAEHKAATWTPKHEDVYVDFVKSGKAAEFITKLQSSDDFAEPDEGWDVAESEAFLQDWCCDLYHGEYEIYEKLGNLQGKQIPRIFSPVTLPLRQYKPKHSSNNDSTSLLQVKGLLMEHISGPTLAQMPDFIPPKHWQSIVDDAISIVHLFSDNNVLNEDIRTSNIIAGQDSRAKDAYRVVMFDLAQCRIRLADQSDAEWGRAKAQQDEEGAIGRMMSMRLKKIGFDLQYTPSHRFKDFAVGRRR